MDQQSYTRRIVAVAVLLIVFGFTNWGQSLFLLFVSILPILVAGLASLFGLGLVLFTWGQPKGRDFSFSLHSLATVIAGIAVFIALVAGYSASYGMGMVKYTGSWQTITELPEIQARWYSYQNAIKALEARAGQDSTTEIGDVDPLFDGENILWRTAKEPTKIHYWTGAVEELKTLYPDGQVETIEQAFACSEDVAIFDNLKWNLIMKGKYLARYDDVFYWTIPSTGATVLIAPITTYRMNILAMVPVWGGYVVVNPDCTMEYHKPSSQVDPRYAGAQLYPPSLVLAEAKNACWRFGGLWNCLAEHINDVEVPAIDVTQPIDSLFSGVNEQPYYNVTDGNPAWTITADAYGANNKALKLLLINDVDSGRMRVFDVTSVSDIMVGPEAALSAARSATPGYIWGEPGEPNKFTLVEPRPMSKDGRLYWAITLTGTDYRATSAVIVVDAQQPEEYVYHFCSVQSLQRWYQNGGGGDIIPCTSAGTPGQTTSSPTTTAPQGSGSYPEMSNDELLRELGNLLRELERRGLLTE